MRDRWFLAMHYRYGTLSIRLIGGWLNISRENGCVMFSERYGLMPSWVVGPCRVTWVKKRPRESTFWRP